MFTLLVLLLLYYLLHLLRLFCSSLKFIAIKNFHLNTIWTYEFFKNQAHRVFHNVNLSYSENILQTNLRTDRAGEFIFKASGGTNIESFFVHFQPCLCLCGFDVCTGLPRKTLDTSLLQLPFKLLSSHINFQR